MTPQMGITIWITFSIIQYITWRKPGLVGAAISSICSAALQANNIWSTSLHRCKHWPKYDILYYRSQMYHKSNWFSLKQPSQVVKQHLLELKSCCVFKLLCLRECFYGALLMCYVSCLTKTEICYCGKKQILKIPWNVWILFYLFVYVYCHDL